MIRSLSLAGLLLCSSSLIHAADTNTVPSIQIRYLFGGATQTASMLQLSNGFILSRLIDADTQKHISIAQLNFSSAAGIVPALLGMPILNQTEGSAEASGSNWLWWAAGGVLVTGAAVVLISSSSGDQDDESNNGPGDSSCTAGFDNDFVFGDTCVIP